MYISRVAFALKIPHLMEHCVDLMKRALILPLMILKVTMDKEQRDPLRYLANASHLGLVHPSDTPALPSWMNALCWSQKRRLAAENHRSQQATPSTLSGGPCPFLDQNISIGFLQGESFVGERYVYISCIYIPIQDIYILYTWRMC